MLHLSSVYNNLGNRLEAIMASISTHFPHVKELTSNSACHSLIHWTRRKAIEGGAFGRQSHCISYR